MKIILTCFFARFVTALVSQLNPYSICFKISNTRCLQNRPKETALAQIRLLLKKQSDHSLLFKIFWPAFREFQHCKPIFYVRIELEKVFEILQMLRCLCNLYHKCCICKLSHGMRFPTIWHFHKCRLECLCSIILRLETPNGVQSVA